jgi:hypothetical protein
MGKYLPCDRTTFSIRLRPILASNGRNSRPVWPIKWVAKVETDVRARVQRDEPTVRKDEIECRAELKTFDGPFERSRQS